MFVLLGTSVAPHGPPASTQNVRVCALKCPSNRLTQTLRTIWFLENRRTLGCLRCVSSGKDNCKVGPKGEHLQIRVRATESGHNHERRKRARSKVP